MLRDYRPKSIYKIPVTEIAKARFPIIDMHSHPYAKTPEQIAEWVGNVDGVGVEKTIILAAAMRNKFDAIHRQYAKYPDRFEVWCGFDFSGYDRPGFGAAAIKELARCYQAGARGVGELHDKGQGMASGKSKTHGMHPDDLRMDPLFEKCAELGLPVSIHVADPIWMYQKMDRTNDGLMNAYQWRLENQPNIVGLSGMVEILERAVKKHSQTTSLPATSPIWITIWRGWGNYSIATPTCMPIFPPVTLRPLPYRALCPSSMPNTRIGLSTEPIWDSKNRCIGSHFGFWSPWTSTSSNRTIRLSLEPERVRPPRFDSQLVYHENAAKILVSRPPKPR